MEHLNLTVITLNLIYNETQNFFNCFFIFQNLTEYILGFHRELDFRFFSDDDWGWRKSWTIVFIDLRKSEKMIIFKAKIIFKIITLLPLSP